MLGEQTRGKGLEVRGIKKMSHRVNEKQVKVMDIQANKEYLVTVFNPSMLPMSYALLETVQDDVSVEWWDPIG